MDSDEENLYDDVDSGNESSGDDVDFAMEDDQGVSPKNRPTEAEEFPYEVLSTEEIVQHMVDCIKDVNTVVEVINFHIYLGECSKYMCQYLCLFTYMARD
jgi:ariadne-1